MGFDLHIHSIYSDGTVAPHQLVTEALEHGLSGIALTDHDTIDGLTDFLEAGLRKQLCVIPGIELTTDFGKTEAHILGYRVRCQDLNLVAKLDKILEARQERVREMLKRLRRHRIDLEWEEVSALAQSRFIGRCHLFKALDNRGLVDRMRRKDAFEYYLGKEGLGYVPHREIETREAIELLLDNGAAPVLAHPGRGGADQLIKQLVDYGLQGLEVYYPAHSPEMVKRYLKIAEAFDLKVTGGSDYHGKMGHVGMGDAQTLELTV